ncbi:glycosyltransferase [Sphingobacterium composti Ten et al. 2007 non Yoo et al. 2007]|uniref:glycosyltransferase n=1 Tax=Sphingobacterium composti TaxID=363260 RepID=UPI0013589164|nr:glycosyltransferase [Sphingobacterium composti Ten et al. 2007 non Yoo et al. 2007]
MKILFIGLVWPEPTSSAAGWRILHLVKCFSKIGEVNFASAALKSIHSADLSSLGVKEKSIFLNDSSFDDYVKNLLPDIVVFDRFIVEEQYGWRIAENCPDALRILDTEDLHFVRLARQEAYKKKVEVDYYSATAKRELASILRSDLSLIISNTEMHILQEDFNIPVEKLCYIPFQEEALNEEQIEILPKFPNRKDFMFIGNFIHEPNFRTVEVLKKEIWPILRKKCPEAELHIYGAYASEKVMQLHNPKERFIIKGRAEDARSTISQYRLMIAPIPFGAGAKGKFVDAMASGTPSITNTLGAESMTESDWNGYIVQDQQEFIKKSVLLYTDEHLWKERQRAGFEIFNSTLADSSYSKDMLEKVKYYKENLQEIRKKHFIAEILLQQQLNATKYMSLWIEEKNKKAQ